MFHPTRSRLLTLAIGAIAAVSIPGTTRAQDAPPLTTQDIAQEVRVAPGSLQGRVLLRGTREVVGRQLLRLQRVGSPEVSEMAASPEGSYQTPTLAPGSYLMEVSQGLVIKLQVTRGAVIRTLDLVVPPGAVRLATRNLAPNPQPVVQAPIEAPPPETAAAQPQPEPWSPPSGFSIFGLSTPVSWVIVGAGAAAIAVPVGIAISGSGGSSESVVSPQQSSIGR